MTLGTTHLRPQFVRGALARSGGVVLCALATASFAQAPQGGDPLDLHTSPAHQTLDVPTLIANLDAPTWLERATAEQGLASLATLRLGDLAPHLAKSTLSLEQRTRLERIARQLYLNSPRAAMGVRFMQGNPLVMPGGATGVQIMSTVDEFDSSRKLKQRDVLVAIDGVPISSIDQARWTIISYDPGDTIQIDLVRDGQTMRVPVQLGAYRNLRDTQGLDMPTLERSWKARLVRETSQGAGGSLARVAVIDSGLTLEDLQIAQQREIAQDVRASQEGDALVLADGQSQRDWETTTGESLRTLNVTGAGGLRGVTSDASAVFFLQSTPTGEEAESLRTLSDNINRLVQQIRLNQGVLRNGQLPVQERARIEAAIDTQRRNLREYRKTMRELRRQLHADTP